MKLVMPTKRVNQPVKSRNKGDHKFPSPAKLVIQRRNFDKACMYVGQRVRTSSIQNKALGTEIPALTKRGYLIVHGDKPGLLIHKVKWDGNDVYERMDDNHYGKVSALNSTGNKKFKAEVIDSIELRGRLIAFNHTMEVERVSDGQRFTVALLNSFNQPYIAGVYVGEHGTLVPLNMEPPATYNKKQVQFVKITDKPVGVRKLLAG